MDIFLYLTEGSRTITENYFRETVYMFHYLTEGVQEQNRELF